MCWFYAIPPKYKFENLFYLNFNYFLIFLFQNKPLLLQKNALQDAQDALVDVRAQAAVPQPVVVVPQPVVPQPVVPPPAAPNTPVQMAVQLALWTPEQREELLLLAFRSSVTFAFNQNAFLLSCTGHSMGDIIGVAYGEFIDAIAYNNIMLTFGPRAHVARNNRRQYMYAFASPPELIGAGPLCYFDGIAIGQKVLNYVTRQFANVNAEVDLFDLPNQIGRSTHRIIIRATRNINFGELIVIPPGEDNFEQP